MKFSLHLLLALNFKHINFYEPQFCHVPCVLLTPVSQEYYEAKMRLHMQSIILSIQYKVSIQMLVPLIPPSLSIFPISQQ